MERLDKLFYNAGLFLRPVTSQLGEKQKTPQGIASIQAVTYPVNGVDVSSWQGAIDWPKLASKIYFAYIRAGRGNDYFDSNYNANVLGARQTGRAYGIYWYMVPRSNSNWKNHLSSMINVWKDSGSQLPPVMDFEETPWDKNATTEWVVKAIKNFYDETGVYPGIYTSRGWWDGHVARSDYPKKCMLWIAQWTSADSPSYVPNDWGAIHNPETWTFWQHAVLANGAEYGVSSSRLDHNKYHYSLAQFNSTYKTNLLPLDDVTPPPPPPPPPDDVPAAVSVTVDSLRIRNSTETANLNNVIGETYLNKVWYPDGIELDSSGRKWYYFGSKKKIYLAAWYTKQAE